MTSQRAGREANKEGDRDRHAWETGRETGMGRTGREEEGEGKTARSVGSESRNGRGPDVEPANQNLLFCYQFFIHHKTSVELGSSPVAHRMSHSGLYQG